jgi:predicted transposase/invertase (TIGR01784 family)
MKIVASLRYGVIFKKAFSDVDVFKGFVRDILGIQLDIDKVETEKEFDAVIGKVKPRFDLYAEDKKQRVIVEIQHDRNFDHYDRFLHYHCAAILEQIESSTQYCPRMTVYTIVVLTSGDKHQTDVSVIDFDPKTLEGQSLGEFKHKIIYICPKYVNEKTPLLYQEWLRVIEDSLDNQIDESQYHLSEIEKVLSHIKRDEVTPEERARMIEESYIEEAEKKALKEGLEKGLKQGVEQGIEQGKLLEKQLMAKSMLQEGLTVEMIAKITGLDVSTISAIRIND